MPTLMNVDPSITAINLGCFWGRLWSEAYFILVHIDDVLIDEEAEMDMLDTCLFLLNFMIVDPPQYV